MVLGAQLSAEQFGDYEKGSRAEQEEVGHRIIENAKRNGVFIDHSTHKDFGERVKGVSGESAVFIDEAIRALNKLADEERKKLTKDDFVDVDEFNKLEKALNNSNDYMYSHLAGEVEARNASARRGMTAEEGFDALAWTTGKQQADRYNLSKSIKDITATG